MRPLVVSVLAVSLASGCSSVLSPDLDVVLPIREIRAPATVQRDVAFNVTFVVLLDGCTRFHSMEMTQSPTGATVIAHGRHPSGEVVCPAVVREQPVELTMAPPFTDPFVIRAEQRDGSQVVAQVRVQ